MSNFGAKNRQVLFIFILLCGLLQPLNLQSSLRCENSSVLIRELRAKNEELEESISLFSIIIESGSNCNTTLQKLLWKEIEKYKNLIQENNVQLGIFLDQTSKSDNLEKY